MSERLSIEPSYRIYNDDNGYYYEVRTDRDGLGCVEVIYNEGQANSQDEPPGAMSPQTAMKVAECLTKVAQELLLRDARDNM